MQRDVYHKKYDSKVTVALLNKEKLEQTWFTKADLNLIHSLMSEDVSDKIDLAQLLSKDEFTSTKILKDCKLDDLKLIASQVINLTPPIRKPTQITSMDGAIELALSYDDYVRRAKLIDEGKTDTEFDEDKLVV